MALPQHPILSIILITVVVALSSSSCHGRNLQDTGRRNAERSLYDVNTFNVDDYGAKGDGKSDDTQAFIKAWDKACSSSSAVFLVPNKKAYLLKQITLKGPCTPGLAIEIDGKIIASNDRSDYDDDTRHWIVIKDVDNLLVHGSGVIDGSGKIWWQNSCKINKNNPCKHAPTAMVFQNCNNLVMNKLKVQNAQQMHVSFSNCNYVNSTGLTISSPGNSPNTDGIHITHSQNVHITKANIATGDDCISIEDGSHTVTATNINCGPGHGISVGSLGDNDSNAHVSDITVNSAVLTGTTNGVRIKTWQGGSGTASNIKFLNIRLKDVDNPIIIDQNYCDQNTPCKKQSSAVQIKDVVYQNIKGSSSSKSAVVLDCDSKYPCQGIVMEEIHIWKTNGKDANAICENVQLSKAMDVFPKC